jgi:hypothetical protein
MEALPRRAYNRQLWREAAAGMDWKVHLSSAAVCLIAVAIRYLSNGRTFQSEWLLNVGLAAAIFISMELAFFGFRRFIAAPHELYVKRLEQGATRDSEIQALRDQVNRLPVPRLALTYNVESLKGFEEEVSNPPIVLHNDGDTAALEARIEPLQLSPLITVTFTTVQRLAVQERVAIAPNVQIRTETGGWELNHNEKHFGLAIQRANAELAHRSVKTQRGSRHWPMIVRCYDASGASYTQNYELILDVPTMRAYTAFVPPDRG